MIDLRSTFERGIALVYSGPPLGYPDLSVSVIGGIDDKDAEAWFERFAAAAAERGIAPPVPGGFPFTTREFEDHAHTLYVTPGGEAVTSPGRVRRRDRERVARDRKRLLHDFAYHDRELWRQGAALLSGSTLREQPAVPPRRVW